MNWLSFTNSPCLIKLSKISNKIYFLITSTDGVMIGPDTIFGSQVSLCNEGNRKVNDNFVPFLYNKESNIWYRPLGSLSINELIPYFPDLVINETPLASLNSEANQKGSLNEPVRGLSSSVPITQGVSRVKRNSEDPDARNVDEEPRANKEPTGQRPTIAETPSNGDRIGRNGREIGGRAGSSRNNESVRTNGGPTSNIGYIDSGEGLKEQSGKPSHGSHGNWQTTSITHESITKKQRVEFNVNALKIAKLVEQNGQLSQDMKAALDRFSGWGGLAEEIVNGNAMEQLSAILDSDELKTVKNSALYGYFTDDMLIRSIWELIETAGYKGGRVCEPSCATGKFISNRPGKLDSNQHFVGVEIDKASAMIAKALHPDAMILDTPFEKAYEDRFEDKSFDLVIGNFPFGEQKIIDKAGDSLSIHNYFLQKNINLLREGGILAAITSTHTLDSKNIGFREAIAKEAQLLAAIRMPSATFEGTSVVSDLLIFRKRTGNHLDQQFEEIPFIQLSKISLEAERDFMTLEGTKTKLVKQNELFDIPINEAFTSGMINAMIAGKASTALVGLGSRPGLILKGGIEEVIEKINVIRSSSPIWFDNLNLFTDYGKPDLKMDFQFSTDKPQYIGNYFYSGGKIYTVTEMKQNGHNNWLLKCDPLILSAKGLSDPSGNPINVIELVKDYIEIRDLAVEILKAESIEDANEVVANSLRIDLNKQYDSFVSKYGYFNESKIRKVIRRDALIGIGLSLEKWDRVNKIATKADIFIREFRLNPEPDNNELSFQDAISHSFSNYGRIDKDLIELKTGQKIDNLIFNNPGLVFHDPETGKYLHRTSYLIGNVVAKLKAASNASEKDARYLHNVKYLESVRPPLIPIKDIDVSFGSKWIPDEIIKQYIHSVYKSQNVGVKVKLSRPEGEVAPALKIIWDSGAFAGFEQVSKATHGTKAVTFNEVIMALMTSSPIVVRKQTLSGSIIDKEQTLSANNIAESVRDDFKRWIVNHQDIANQLEEIYNSVVNVYNHEIDMGDVNFEFKGMNKMFIPRAHQREFVLKALINGSMLNADPVGAGKTAMQVMLAHELKRLKLCNLPFIVVPNHILYQTAARAQFIYPNARICIATKDDFVKENRSAFVAKAAMNNWDFGIMTYSMNQQLMPNSDYLAERIRDDISDLEDALKEASKENDRLSARSILLKLRSAEQRLEELMDNATNNAFFLELGHTKIDALLYDEFHKLKNLDLNMIKSIPGISNQGSNIAFIEHVKMQYLMDVYYKGEEKGIYGFTATPVSNSLSELYTIFRMLKPSLLRAEGIYNFNDWAAQYGEVKNQLEVLPEGKGFQMKARLSTFKNLPELLSTFRTFTQAHTRSELDLGAPTYTEKVVTSEPNIWQRYIFDTLVKRAKLLRTNSTESISDNFLHIVNDAAMAAISHHALYPNIQLPDLHTKLDLICENFFRIYCESSESLGTQLVFLDRSIPSSKNWNAYAYCKAKLVSLGIPASELVFIHDFKTDEARDDVFDKLRRGVVRGCFGSTEKLGTGTDVQDRLIAIHDGDIPWTPKELEQRLGRVVRQGNMNPHVFIYRYTTKGSFDVFRLETIKRKDLMISAAFSSPRTAMRRFDEDTSIDYDTLIAETTDNPIIREKAKLDSTIMTLQRKQDDFEMNQWRTKNRLNECSNAIKKYGPIVEKLKKATSRAHAYVSQIVLPPQEKDLSETALRKHQAYCRLAQAGFTTFGCIPNLQDGPVTWIDPEGSKIALETILQSSVDSNSKPVVFSVYGESGAARRTLTRDAEGKWLKIDTIRYFDAELTDAEGAYFLDEHYGEVIHNIYANKSFLFDGVLNFIPVELVSDLNFSNRRLNDAQETIHVLEKIDVNSTFPQAQELKDAKVAREAIELQILEIMQEIDKKEAENPIMPMGFVLKAFRKSGFDPNFNPYSCSVSNDLEEIDILELDESNFSVVKDGSNALSQF